MDNERASLRHRIHLLESSKRRARRELASRSATIRRLRTMLMTALEQDDSMQSVGDDDDYDDDIDEDNWMENDMEERFGDFGDVEYDAAWALWDENDNVHRCRECLHEVEEGYCRHCDITYDWDSDAAGVGASVPAVSDAASEERGLTARGTTPLQDIGFLSVPAAYRTRRDEFFTLIQRGATPEMCEAFLLEYSESHGIVAWADQDIFDTFSGPAMVEGDKWKIYLGRRVQLDEDDMDGSEFLEGLLEDVLMYPVARWPLEWQTCEESAGIWATRPQPRMVSSSVAGSDGDDSDESDDDDYEEPNDGDMNDMYEEDGHYIPANPQAHPDRGLMYDAALEFPFRPNNGAVIEVDEYETEDEDGSNMEEDDDEDPSWAITAQMPDTVYDDEEDEEESLLGDDTVMVAEGRVQIEEGSDVLDSDPGSGWDSDEQLSGDEDLGWRQEWEPLQNNRPMDGARQG